MSLTTLSPFEAGLWGSLAAAGATGLGGAFVLVKRHWNPGRVGQALGVAGALLIAMSVLSLTLPAGRLLAPQLGDLSLVAGILAGLTLGALGMRALGHFTDRMESFAQGRGPWLILATLALHNIPEGLAVGTALAGPSVQSGLPLLGGLLLHDLMEGLAVASAALAWGWSPGKAALAALLTGLMEPFIGIPAAWVTTQFPCFTPWILLGTAGGMIIMLREEILPLLVAAVPHRSA